jgi:hypothetical protein
VRLAIQPDGRIVVVGAHYPTHFNFTNPGYHYDATPLTQERQYAGTTAESSLEQAANPHHAAPRHDGCKNRGHSADGTLMRATERMKRRDIGAIPVHEDFVGNGRDAQRQAFEGCKRSARSAAKGLLYHDVRDGAG